MPEIQQQHGLGADDRIGHHVDEFLTRGIDPVQVLDENESRPRLRSGAHEQTQQFDQPLLAHRGIDLRRWLVRIDQTEKAEQQRKRFVVHRQRRHDAGHPLPRLGGLHGGLDAQIVAGQFEDGLIGRRMTMRRYAGFINPIAAIAAAFGEFEAKPALSGAGFTDNADGTGLSGGRAGEFCLEQIDLGVAANQRTECTSGCGKSRWPAHDAGAPA